MAKVVVVRSNPIEPDSRVEKEASVLLKAGHQVCLLVWDRESNHKTYADNKVIDGIAVERIRIGAKAVYGAGMKSLKSFLKFQQGLFTWLIKNKNRYDICHLCDFDTAFVGSKACKIVGKKYVFDIFDYLSTNAKSGVKLWIKKMEDSTISNADSVIICTEQRRRQIADSKPKRLTVIHNSPQQIQPVYTEINYDKIRIAYVGILQDYRLLKEIVHAISNMPEIELHIGGFGKYDSFIQKVSEKKENIKFYGKLSYEKTLELEAKCNILTAIYDPAIGNHIYAAPNKFYESLMLGKPVLMVKGTGMSDVVEEEDIGEVIEYSEQGFINGLNRLIKRRNDWPAMSKKMKTIYLERFSWDEMSNRLTKLYEELCNEECDK